MNRKEGKIVFALLAYNHEQFIEQCVRSLAEQTYHNFSVVFIDDGSTDRTFAMGKALLREADIDATCIQSHDNGICRNLNLALRTCSDGEFFAMLSADDWLPPNSFEERVVHLDAHPEDAMVYSPVMHYWEEEQRFKLLKRPYGQGSILGQLLEENFIPANTAMVRTEIFEEIGGFDEDLAVEDWDMWLRIAKRYEIGFVNTPLAYYRLHASNMSCNSKAMYEAELAVLRKYLYHEVARRRYGSRMVEHVVLHEPIGIAAKGLWKHGSLDRRTAKQAVKLVLRALFETAIVRMVRDAIRQWVRGSDRSRQ